MHVYIYMYICIYKYISKYVYIYICMHVYMSIEFSLLTKAYKIIWQVLTQHMSHERAVIQLTCLM